MSTKTTSSRSKSGGWAHELRTEIDTLILAREGRGTSHLLFAISVAAVTADTGALTSSTGKPGYAWNPISYEGRSDPTAERIRAAGASVGRLMAGGHPDHRVYLAVMEAVYVVTTTQDYDVIAKIESLWDERKQLEIEEQEAAPAPRRGVMRRLLDWMRGIFTASTEAEVAPLPRP